MNAIYEPGDVFLEVDGHNGGFVIVESYDCHDDIVYIIIWFDDGLRGAFKGENIQILVSQKFVRKASDAEAFKIKLIYSEKLNNV
jgi:hypothetical protein